MNIALAGNPNSGKSTMFNQLTGSKQYVGNWPGVTVERKEGKKKYNNYNLNIVDLPGTYSLLPFSLEERVARDYIMEGDPDVIINIVDGSNLARNLYLTLQLIELGKPVIVALNMIDVAENRGIEIDFQLLQKELGVPIIPVIARKGKGINELLDKVIDFIEGKEIFKPKDFNYGQDIERYIDELSNEIIKEGSFSGSNIRGIVIKILEGDKDLESIVYNKDLKKLYTGRMNNNVTVADKRYELIDGIVSNVVTKKGEDEDTISDKIDRVLMNRYFALPIFALMMYGVFWFTFTAGGFFLEKIDIFFSQVLTLYVSDLLNNMSVAPWLISLIVDGIIGGVGGVLTFLPNIAFLFIAISILEDSGYMARVAFIMDKAMRKIGLNGKAFIPMIMGFGCNVPAIMGTRTLEDEKDRLTTILINPFMSCGARLPVYTLFASAFFPGNESKVVFSLYILGIIIAIIMGLIFKKTLFRGESSALLMELPPYRMPTLKGVVINVWDKVKGFLTKASTVIFAASIILWIILGFNISGPSDMASSFGAQFGKIIAPIFKPIGFGTWQMGLSLITGLLAKEVVVSNLSIIYGLGETPNVIEFAKALGPEFTSVSAYALLVFILLYTPCVAVIAVIRRETNSWKWAIFSMVYQFAVAWIVAFMVYRIGILLF